MSTLYDITNEYIEILMDCQNQEELSDELIDKLESINETFDEKANNIALVIEELKADCEAINREINRLNNRFTAKVKNLRRLEAYLKDKMVYIGKNKVETPIHTISLRKSVKTEVSSKFIEWAIENKKEDFITKRVTYTPNKMLIKEEIENGNLNCPYVQIVENQNLIIK